MFLHDFDDFLLLEISSSDIELTYCLCDNWLLSLDLEIELDIGLLGHLDGLAGHLFASSLELLHEVFNLVGSHHSKDVVGSNENDSFLLLFKGVSELWEEREVESWGLLLGFDVVEFRISTGIYDEFHLEVKNLLVLLLGHSREFLVLVEESDSSWENLSLIDTPCITKLVHDIHLAVHDVNCSFESNIVESDNTV